MKHSRTIRCGDIGEGQREVSDWKPGDVAIIDNQYIVIRAQADCQACKDIPKKTPGDHWHAPHMRLGCGYDNIARPLVIIDPEDRAQVERLRNAIDYALKVESGVLHSSSKRQRVDATQAALRSLLEPMKPEEPTGLGAVVEDKWGRLWVRLNHNPPTDDPWKPYDSRDRRCAYEDIAAVKVLSSGVTP